MSPPNLQASCLCCASAHMSVTFSEMMTTLLSNPILVLLLGCDFLAYALFLFFCAMDWVPHPQVLMLCVARFGDRVYCRALL